jgi:hypothetical protein
MIQQTLAETYSLDQDGKHREASVFLLQYIEERFVNNDISSINELFAQVDLDKLGVWSIIGLVRSTARARSMLSAWQQILDKSITTLEKLNADPQKMLVGLI